MQIGGKIDRRSRVVHGHVERDRTEIGNGKRRTERSGKRAYECVVDIQRKSVVGIAVFEDDLVPADAEYAEHGLQEIVQSVRHVVIAVLALRKRQHARRFERRGVRDPERLSAEYAVERAVHEIFDSRDQSVQSDLYLDALASVDGTERGGDVYPKRAVLIIRPDKRLRRAVRGIGVYLRHYQIVITAFGLRYVYRCFEREPVPERAVKGQQPRGNGIRTRKSVDQRAEIRAVVVDRKVGAQRYVAEGYRHISRYFVGNYVLRAARNGRLLRGERKYSLVGGISRRRKRRDRPARVVYRRFEHYIDIGQYLKQPVKQRLHADIQPRLSKQRIEIDEIENGRYRPESDGIDIYGPDCLPVRRHPRRLREHIEYHVQQRCRQARVSPSLPKADSRGRSPPARLRPIPEYIYRIRCL